VRDLRGERKTRGQLGTARANRLRRILKRIGRFVLKLAFIGGGGGAKTF